MMLNKLTYKQKNKALIGAAIAFLLIAYWLAFEKTITQYSMYKDLKKQVKIATGSASTIRTYQTQLTTLEKKVGHFASGKIITQDELLQIISDECKLNGLILSSFPKATVSITNNYNIETNKIKVTGTYNDILKTVYALEQKYSVGKIASIQFDKIKDKKSRRYILTASIYLQNIKTRSDET